MMQSMGNGFGMSAKRCFWGLLQSTRIPKSAEFSCREWYCTAATKSSASTARPTDRQGQEIYWSSRRNSGLCCIGDAIAGLLRDSEDINNICPQHTYASNTHEHLTTQRTDYTYPHTYPRTQSIVTSHA
jgi:hypothetical protein